MAVARRERTLSGPHRTNLEDVDALNGVFADAFTDRYRRDGLIGVRVPKLNPEIWRYALQDAGEGAMLWRDEAGRVVAFNIAHQSGAEGWMGPLAVRPDRQSLGIGSVIVRTAAEWLQGQGVGTIGLETMPRTVDNIGFYSRLGFLPRHLTVTLVGAAEARETGRVVLLSELASGDLEAVLAGVRGRLHRSAPMYDYTREVLLTLELGIGDGAVIQAGDVSGFALWHTAGLVEARSPEELRLLKLFADSAATFGRLVDILEMAALSAGLNRVAIRCQTVCTEAYTWLVHRGYRVRWTDLRMTLDGFPEHAVPGNEVLFSNWEI